MEATTTNQGLGAGKGSAMKVTQSFKSFDGSTIHVLADGRAVKESVLGLMLLTSVGGEFVRFIASLDEVDDGQRIELFWAPNIGTCGRWVTIPGRDEDEEG